MHFSSELDAAVGLTPLAPVPATASHVTPALSVPTFSCCSVSGHVCDLAVVTAETNLRDTSFIWAMKSR